MKSQGYRVRRTGWLPCHAACRTRSPQGLSALDLPSWPADRSLRAWQRAAAAAVFTHPSDAFLAAATPAAGKTTFGLLAREAARRS
jgi:hypothetical protein